MTVRLNIAYFNRCRHQFPRFIIENNNGNETNNTNNKVLLLLFSSFIKKSVWLIFYEYYFNTAKFYAAKLQKNSQSKILKDPPFNTPDP